MDTREESLRLLKEAEEDLGRATRYSGLKDWITTIHYAQLATEFIENFWRTDEYRKD